MKLPFYSDEYEGEFVIHNITIKDGKRTEDREWVPRTVTNDDHRGFAFVIGNGTGRTMQGFDIKMIENHSGGLLAGMRAQTYGCNALYRDIKTDFLVAMNDEMVEELANTDYPTNNIVYSTAKNVVKYPGKFYLIPQNIAYYNAGTIATYIAAFDRHKEIYLLGFDNQRSPGMNDNVYAGTDCYAPEKTEIYSDKWIPSMKIIFDAYKETNFHWVSPNPNNAFPEEWNWCKNVSKLDYKKFISDMDVGVQLRYNWKD